MENFEKARGNGQRTGTDVFSSCRKAFMPGRAGVTCGYWETSIKHSHKSHQLIPCSSRLEKRGLIQSPILPSVNTTESAAFLHVFPLTFSIQDFRLAFSLCHPFLANPFPSFISFFFSFFISNFIHEAEATFSTSGVLSSKICKVLPLTVVAFPILTKPLLNITAYLYGSIVIREIKNM